MPVKGYKLFIHHLLLPLDIKDFQVVVHMVLVVFLKITDFGGVISHFSPAMGGFRHE
jgi:hypothetical protein